MKPEEIVTMAMLEADTLLSYLDADRLATAALRALEEAGWAVVPRDGNPAIFDLLPIPYEPQTQLDVWRAMLDAAGRDEGAEGHE